MITGSTGIREKDTDILLVSINGQGQEKWRRQYDFGTNENGATILKWKNLGFAIAVNQRTPNYSTGLLFVDRSGNIVKSRLYSFSEAYRTDTMISVNPEGFLLTGIKVINKDPQMLVIKMDNDGAIEWERHIGTEGYESGQESIQISDGGFISIGWTFHGQGGNRVIISNLDKNGNVRWFKHKKGIEGLSLVRSDSNEYLLSIFGIHIKLYKYFEKFESSLGKASLFITAIDEEGEVLWSKEKTVVSDIPFIRKIVDKLPVIVHKK